MATFHSYAKLPEDILQETHKDAEHDLFLLETNLWIPHLDTFGRICIYWRLALQYLTTKYHQILFGRLAVKLEVEKWLSEYLLNVNIIDDW